VKYSIIPLYSEIYCLFANFEIVLFQTYPPNHAIRSFILSLLTFMGLRAYRLEFQAKATLAFNAAL